MQAGQEGSGGRCHPAVLVPLLVGEGPDGVPDFVKLEEEAYERSGGLAALRVMATLTWEDVSAKLERPKGMRLEEAEDVGEVWRRGAGEGGEEGDGWGEDGSEKESEEGEEEGWPVGDGGNDAWSGAGLSREGRGGGREAGGLSVSLGMKATGRQEYAALVDGRGEALEEEEGNTEEEEGEEGEDGEGEEEGDEPLPDCSLLRISEGKSTSAQTDGEQAGGRWTTSVGSRFHPLTQAMWERNIQWGTGRRGEEEEEEEEGKGLEEEELSAEASADIVPSSQAGNAPVNGGEESGRERGGTEGEGKGRGEEEMGDLRVILARHRAEETRRERLRWILAAKRREAAAMVSLGAGARAAGLGSEQDSSSPRLSLYESTLAEEAERVLQAPFPLNAELNGQRWTRNIIWGKPKVSHRARSLSRWLPGGVGVREQRPGPRAQAPLPWDRLIIDRNDPRIYWETPSLPRTDLHALGLMSSTRTASLTPEEQQRQQQFGRHRTLQVPSIEHAECALRHETTIADPARLVLPPDVLRSFHRPRLPLRLQDLSWTLRTPKDKSGQAGGGGRGALAGGHPMSTRTIRTTKDLNAYEGELVVVEYPEERPLLLSNPGMASKLLNLWRLSPQNVEAERAMALERHAAGLGGGGGKSRGPPRITRENLGASSVAMDLDRVHAGVPDFKEGQTCVLYPEDPSPFIGQIEDGMRQLALFNNLYKAPLFEHKAKPTDFLLVRSHPKHVREPLTGESAGESECYAVREIPRVYLSGQMEPLREVFHPDDGRFREFRDRLIKLALVVKIHGGERGADMDRRVSVIDLVRLFDGLADYLPDAGPGRDKEREKAVLVLNQLKQVAHELQGKHTENHWSLNKDVVVEDVLREITPEEVCIFESMCSGVRRLLSEGISIVGRVTSFAPARIEPILARNLQCLLQDRQARAEKARRSAELLKGGERGLEAEEVANKLQVLYEEVRQLIAVGAYLLDELYLAPWSLTHYYHAITNEKAYGGIFKLTGLGDPSGIGEGFSFLPRHQREAGRSFKEVLPTLDPALQEIIGETPPVRMGVAMMNKILTHVWSVPHLRRIAQHRLSTAGYGAEFEEVMQLTRVPKKVRVQVVLDVDAGEGAGGIRAGMLEYVAACDRIWNKQLNALTDESGAFGDEEGMAGMELDLDDPEGAPEKGQGQGSRAGWGGGMEGGGKGTFETEADALAVQRELAERARILAEQRQEAEIARQQKALMAGVALPSWQRPRKVVKRLIKETDVDGTERYRVEFLFQPEEVERVRMQRAEELEKLRKKARRARKREAAGLAVGEEGQAGEGDEWTVGGNKLVLSVQGKQKASKRKRASVTLNISSLKKMATEHKEQQQQKKRAQDEEARMLYSRQYLKLGARGSEGADREVGEEGAGGGSGPYGRKTQRKPHLLLNLQFDVIYSGVETKPYAKPFKRLRGRGMDLERVKKKITDYRYESRQELLDDFATIVRETVEAEEGGGGGVLLEYVRAVQADVIKGVRSLDESSMAALEAEIVVQNATSIRRQRKANKMKGGRGGGRGRGGARGRGNKRESKGELQVGGTEGIAGGRGILLPSPPSQEPPPVLLGPLSPPRGMDGGFGGNGGGEDQPLIFVGEDSAGGGQLAPSISLPGEASDSGEEEVLQIDQL
jgi:transcription initiation factor TFIID subunit 1